MWYRTYTNRLWVPKTLDNAQYTQDPSLSSLSSLLSPLSSLLSPLWNSISWGRALNLLHNLITGYIWRLIRRKRWQNIRPNIGCHDDQAILKVYLQRVVNCMNRTVQLLWASLNHSKWHIMYYLSALAIGEVSFIQHLQQKIWNFPMGFFEFIKQHNGVWMSSNCLSQRPTCLLVNFKQTLSRDEMVGRKHAWIGSQPSSYPT